MKKGWLVINGFLKSDKFKEIYSLLQSSSTKFNIELVIKTNVELCDVLDNSLPFTRPDFVLFWDKDVLLASRLENLGLKLFNSANAIETCDDKGLTALTLASNGIAHPKTIIAPKTFENIGYNDLSFLCLAIEKLGFPLIIKESFGSFGKQVYLAKTYKQAKRIIKKLSHKPFILQEFISDSYGKDVRINVVGEKVVASMLRYNNNDFRSNISNGGKMQPFTPSKKQESLAIKASKALKLDFGGIDILFGKDDKPIVCEVNSNLHFKSTLSCTNVNVADYIMEYINGKI